MSVSTPTSGAADLNLRTIHLAVVEKPKGEEGDRKAEARKEVATAEAQQTDQLNQAITRRDVDQARKAVASLQLRDAERAVLDTLLPTLITPESPDSKDAAPKDNLHANPAQVTDGSADVATSQQVDAKARSEGATPDKHQADGSAQHDAKVLRGDEGIYNPKSNSVLNRTLAKHITPEAQKEFAQALVHLNTGTPHQKAQAVQVIAQALQNVPLSERAEAHAEIFALIKSLRTIPKDHPNFPVVQKALQQAQVLAKVLGPRTEAELPVYAQKANPQAASKDASGQAPKAEGQSHEKVKILACTDAQQAEPGQCKDYANAVASPKELAQLETRGSNLSVSCQPEAQPNNQPATVFVAQGSQAGREQGDNSGRRSRGLATSKPGEKADGEVLALEGRPGQFRGSYARVMG